MRLRLSFVCLILAQGLVAQAPEPGRIEGKVGGVDSRLASQLAVRLEPVRDSKKHVLIRVCDDLSLEPTSLAPGEYEISVVARHLEMQVPTGKRVRIQARKTTRCRALEDFSLTQHFDLVRLRVTSSAGGLFPQASADYGPTNNFFASRYGAVCADLQGVILLLTPKEAAAPVVSIGGPGHLSKFYSKLAPGNHEVELRAFKTIEFLFENAPRDLDYELVPVVYQVGKPRNLQWWSGHWATAAVGSKEMSKITLPVYPAAFDVAFVIRQDLLSAPSVYKFMDDPVLEGARIVLHDRSTPQTFRLRFTNAGRKKLEALDPWMLK